MRKLTVFPNYMLWGWHHKIEIEEEYKKDAGGIRFGKALQTTRTCFVKIVLPNI